MIIDTHCHVGAVWYEPAETLLFQMDRCGVERAVLTQMLGQFDNAYQQACAKRWPDRFISVVAVDPSLPASVATLQALAAQGARGLRLRPNARSPGDDPLAIWRAAVDLGLNISCVGTTAQFTAPAFGDLVAEMPQLSIVLEHLGGIARPDADETAEKVWELAAFPNITLKVPGLGQLSKRAAPLPTEGSPFEPGGEAPILRAVQAFSSKRLMWASDFPVVSSREGYGRALSGAQECLASLSETERAEVFGGTAAKLFNA